MSPNTHSFYKKQDNGSHDPLTGYSSLPAACFPHGTSVPPNTYGYFPTLGHGLQTSGSYLPHSRHYEAIGDSSHIYPRDSLTTHLQIQNLAQIRQTSYLPPLPQGSATINSSNQSYGSFPYNHLMLPPQPRYGAYRNTDSSSIQRFIQEQSTRASTSNDSSSSEFTLPLHQSETITKNNDFHQVKSSQYSPSRDHIQQDMFDVPPPSVIVDVVGIDDDEDENIDDTISEPSSEECEMNNEEPTAARCVENIWQRNKAKCITNSHPSTIYSQDKIQRDNPIKATESDINIDSDIDSYEASYVETKHVSLARNKQTLTNSADEREKDTIASKTKKDFIRECENNDTGEFNKQFPECESLKQSSDSGIVVDPTASKEDLNEVHQTRQGSITPPSSGENGDDLAKTPEHTQENQAPEFVTPNFPVSNNQIPDPVDASTPLDDENVWRPWNMAGKGRGIKRRLDNSPAQVLKHTFSSYSQFTVERRPNTNTDSNIATHAVGTPYNFIPPTKRRCLGQSQNILSPVVASPSQKYAKLHRSASPRQHQSQAPKRSTHSFTISSMIGNDESHSHIHNSQTDQHNSLDHRDSGIHDTHESIQQTIGSIHDHSNPPTIKIEAVPYESYNINKPNNSIHTNYDGYAHGKLASNSIHQIQDFQQGLQAYNANTQSSSLHTRMYQHSQVSLPSTYMTQAGISSQNSLNNLWAYQSLPGFKFPYGVPPHSQVNTVINADISSSEQQALDLSGTAKHHHQPSYHNAKHTVNSNRPTAPPHVMPPNMIVTPGSYHNGSLIQNTPQVPTQSQNNLFAYTPERQMLKNSPRANQPSRLQPVPGVTLASPPPGARPARSFTVTKKVISKRELQAAKKSQQSQSEEGQPKKRDRPPMFGEVDIEPFHVEFYPCAERTIYCNESLEYQAPKIPHTREEQDKLKHELTVLFANSNLPKVPPALHYNVHALAYFPFMQHLFHLHLNMGVDIYSLKFGAYGQAFENPRLAETGETAFNEQLDSMCYVGTDNLLHCLVLREIDGGARCDHVASELGKMRRHAKNHYPEKKWVCCYCRAQMPDLTDMERHTSTHTILKPFKCTECSRFFAQKVTLGIHMEQHHKIKLEKMDPKKSFTCRQDGCLFQEDQREECIEHLKNHHPNDEYLRRSKRGMWPFGCQADSAQTTNLHDDDGSNTGDGD